MELIKTTIEYKYLWGYCERVGEALPTIAISIAIIISIKIVISFILAIRRKKEKTARP